MIAEILLRYLHFISIFVIISSIVAEHLLLKKVMTRQEIRRLAIIDGIYALFVLVLLAAGFSLWFGVGKDASFYSQNWIFMTKITLFGIVGILSIYPSIFFARQKKGDDPEEQVAIPKAIKWCIRLELLLLFIMPLLASYMAKGIGFIAE